MGLTLRCSVENDVTKLKCAGALFVGCFMSTLGDDAIDEHADAPLPAIQYLINACALGAERKVNGITPKSLDERFEWVIDLFERLSTPGRQV